MPIDRSIPNPTNCFLDHCKNRKGATPPKKVSRFVLGHFQALGDVLKFEQLSQVLDRNPSAKLSAWLRQSRRFADLTRGGRCFDTVITKGEAERW